MMPFLHYRVLLVVVFLAASVLASEQRGQVTFNGFPVPGAIVSAVQGEKRFSTVTDLQGNYVFTELTDGTWSIEVTMTGFMTIRQEVAVAPNAVIAHWDLRLLPIDKIGAEPQTLVGAPAQPVPSNETNPPVQVQSSSPDADDDLSERASDALVINGSMNNGAASPFSQTAAFGNNRFGSGHLYNGGLGLILDNSRLDAAPYSLAGQSEPKAAYSRLTGTLTFGGPLRIPHLLHNGPNFFVGYQWKRNNNALNQSAVMPTLAARSGIFSSTIIDPETGLPFPGDTIPQSRLNPQALTLLQLYPLPNVVTSSVYNYQVPIVSPTHQDALQMRLTSNLRRNNQIYGGFAFQSTRSDNTNVFGFLDSTSALGLNTNLNWSHRLGKDWSSLLGYQFSHLATHVYPFFANRTNISGEAGILGNNQDPSNWGPPTLTFSSGIAGLFDAQSSFDRNQTSGLSYSTQWNHHGHNVTFGADFRRQEFNVLAQQDPRGSLSFTGIETGSDLADFLLGIPATISIAFGNANKYFRESVYDAYGTDDWRVNASLSLNIGLRWEYSAPITELYNRLVNLDVTPGFSAAAPVVAQNPIGPLTGEHYPNSLIKPDKNGFEPRIAMAWRPIPASSLIVRAGYGTYYDTSVYQTMADQMSQQPPLSRSFSLQNNTADPLMLANAFNASVPALPNTFGIDPNFRVGYAQNWQLTVQRDLPGSLQLAATYLGVKGTHAIQAFLPNTFPIGAANPCTTCPTGFVYLTSTGDSNREAAQLQLRRRLHSGFAGSLRYVFSKSIDDAATLGGQGASAAQGSAQNSNGSTTISSPQQTISSLAIAQNWLSPQTERGLSVFDQRHVLSLQIQYTTGMGMAGGTLLDGWSGTLLKDWTISTQISAGTGTPETPVYFAPTPGTGFTGVIRPDYTGAPLYSAPTGLFLNPAAYAPPVTGQWGNAGRGSITGPSQFTLSGSLGRTFRLGGRFNLDLRVDSNNALNHVTYTAWNTTINSGLFGVPVSTNAMRSMQLTLRLRF